MINNVETNTKSRWNWDILLPALTGKQAIGDVDGIFERRGQFLLLETKLPGKELEPAQRWMYEKLARTGFFTVMILWGWPNEPRYAQFFYPGRRIREGQMLIDELIRRVYNWRIWAEKQGPTPYYTKPDKRGPRIPL